MTDRFKEQADNLLRSLSPFWFERQDAIAASLSEMHEAGRREEREECAKVAEQTFVPAADYANGLISAAIRRREVKEAAHD